MKLAGEAGSLLQDRGRGSKTPLPGQNGEWLIRPKDERSHSLPGRGRNRSGRRGSTRSRASPMPRSPGHGRAKVSEPSAPTPGRSPTNYAGYRRKSASPRMRNGAAFIELCRKRATSSIDRSAVRGSRANPRRTTSTTRLPADKNDVYAAFIGPLVDKLVPPRQARRHASRTGILPRRSRKLAGRNSAEGGRPVVVADLGYGVLNTAMVETAAYCLEERCDGWKLHLHPASCRRR